MKEIQTFTFRHGSAYTDVLGVIQPDKVFKNGSVIKTKETFFDSKERDCVSYQIEVPYMETISGQQIQSSIFSKIVARDGVRDAVEKLKLKVGDRIRFTGRYSRRKGDVKWFDQFDILHPSFVVKLKKGDDSAI